MSLPVAPPDYHGLWKAVTAPIVRGEQGWRVYALERGIKVHRSSLDLVGEFNVGLLRAVKRYQSNHGLDTDGIAGPRTQLTVLAEAAMAADEAAGLPDGLSLGFVVWEGGSVLAATNWTVPGGVDVGPVQKRLVGPPFSRALMEQFFDPWQALRWAALRLDETRDDFYRRRPSLGKTGALRTAVLNHNWPAGAEQIVQQGHLTNPNLPAEWAPKPDGGFYTRGEWAVEYPRRIMSFTGL